MGPQSQHDNAAATSCDLLLPQLVCRSRMYMSGCPTCACQRCQALPSAAAASGHVPPAGAPYHMGRPSTRAHFCSAAGHASAPCAVHSHQLPAARYQRISSRRALTGFLTSPSKRERRENRLYPLNRGTGAHNPTSSCPPAPLQLCMCRGRRQCQRHCAGQCRPAGH